MSQLYIPAAAEGEHDLAALLNEWGKLISAHAKRIDQDNISPEAVIPIAKVPDGLSKDGGVISGLIRLLAGDELAGVDLPLTEEQVNFLAENLLDAVTQTYDVSVSLTRGTNAYTLAGPTDIIRSNRLWFEAPEGYTGIDAHLSWSKSGFSVIHDGVRAEDYCSVYPAQKERGGITVTFNTFCNGDVGYTFDFSFTITFFKHGEIVR